VVAIPIYRVSGARRDIGTPLTQRFPRTPGASFSSRARAGESDETVIFGLPIPSRAANGPPSGDHGTDRSSI